MTSERAPRALVAEVLTAPDVDRDHVPRLLDLVDVGDRRVRLGAATALCIVADEHPGVVASLTGPTGRWPPRSPWSTSPVGIRRSSKTG